MPDDRNDPLTEGGPGDPITGEMSEEAITAAAVANDSGFMERLTTLYDHFVVIGEKATSGGAYTDAMNAFGNATNIANSMHNIAIMREHIVRKRFDLHADRADIDIDIELDGPPLEDEPFGDAVGDL